MRDCGWPAAIFSSVFVRPGVGLRFILQVPISKRCGPTRLRHGPEQCILRRSVSPDRSSSSTRRTGTPAARPTGWRYRSLLTKPRARRDARAFRRAKRRRRSRAAPIPSSVIAWRVAGGRPGSSPRSHRAGRSVPDRDGEPILSLQAASGLGPTGRERQRPVRPVRPAQPVVARIAVGLQRPRKTLERSRHTCRRGRAHRIHDTRRGTTAAVANHRPHVARPGPAPARFENPNRGLVHELPRPLQFRRASLTEVERRRVPNASSMPERAFLAIQREVVLQIAAPSIRASAATPSSSVLIAEAARGAVAIDENLFAANRKGRVALGVRSRAVRLCGRALGVVLASARRLRFSLGFCPCNARRSSFNRCSRRRLRSLSAASNNTRRKRSQNTMKST